MVGFTSLEKSPFECELGVKMMKLFEVKKSGHLVFKDCFIGITIFILLISILTQTGFSNELAFGTKIQPITAKGER